MSILSKIRAFPLSLLLHVLLLSLLLMGLRHWSKARVNSIPIGVALDVIQPLPAQVAPEEPQVLEQALAVIPAESPELPVPVMPEVSSAMIPDPAIQSPQGREASMSAVALAKTDLFAAVLAEERHARDYSPSPETATMQSATKNGRPIALSEIKPHYPSVSRLRGEAGRVTIQVHVSDKGTVESVEVVTGSGHLALDDSAVAAIRTARFKPAEQDGKSVRSALNLQFEFRLEER